MSLCQQVQEKQKGPSRALSQGTQGVIDDSYGSQEKRYSMGLI